MRQTTTGKLSTPKARLKAFCDQLNKEKGSERGRELVKFIEEWLTVASLGQMSPVNRSLYKDVIDSVKPYLETSQTKKWGVWRVYPKQPDNKDPHDFAVWMLSFFIDNPMCEKLAGPCARCRNFFIQRRASQTVYCSRRCGNAATALARRREQLSEERDEKLRRVKAALRGWKKNTHTREDWKLWVANQVGVHKRFITIAVNKGDLVPPQKGE
jgi:hypothetical protein